MSKLKTKKKKNYLGIVLDSQLKFDEHKKGARKNVWATLQTFRQVKHCLPFNKDLISMHAMGFFLISHTA